MSSTQENSSRNLDILNDEDEQPSSFKGNVHKTQSRLARMLESRKAHWITIGLVAADFTFVFSVIIVSFLWPEFEEKQHIVFTTLEYIAYLINAIFVVEVLLKLFVFGINYYIKDQHWGLHLFDAIIIITTFLLDFFLSGKQREVAGLLILFRLWRLIKALSTVAVGLIEYDEEKSDKLKAQIKLLNEEVEALLAEIDKIAEEDNWDEQKRNRIYKIHQNYENYIHESDTTINVNVNN